MLNTTPAFNLKAVLNETGIAADTLRAWERRYGLPMPERTPGGHRLYSQSDIETVKWLMARQEEGLSISRAVDLWNEHLAAGRDPLAEFRAQDSPALTAFPGASSLDALREAWLQACLDFDESEAENVLNQAFGVYPVEQVCTQVLQRALSQMGEFWYSDRASAQQEHFASSLAMRRLDALLAAAPRPTRRQTVLIGCPPDEWHAFIPLMLTLFLRRRGLNTVYLGANVPLIRFQEAVQAIGPELVILTAQQLHSAATLMQIARLLRDHTIPAGYGGRIFNLHPELQARIPAQFLGYDITSATQTVENLLVNPSAFAGEIPLDTMHQAALSGFDRKRPLVEANVAHSQSENSAAQRYITIANQFMGDNLSAALKFGNLSLLDSEIHWIEGLLGNVAIGSQELHAYLSHYHNAVSAELGQDGALIANWLSNTLANRKNWS
jgi:DNA-binding transcriptional MerR regulator